MTAGAAEIGVVGTDLVLSSTICAAFSCSSYVDWKTSSELLLVVGEGFARVGQREGLGLEWEWVLVLLQTLLVEEKQEEYRSEYQLARRMEKEDQEVGGVWRVLQLRILREYPVLGEYPLHQYPVVEVPPVGSPVPASASRVLPVHPHPYLYQRFQNLKSLAIVVVLQ